MSRGGGFDRERSPERQEQKARSEHEPPSAEDARTPMSDAGGAFNFSALVTCEAILMTGAGPTSAQV